MTGKAISSALHNFESVDQEQTMTSLSLPYLCISNHQLSTFIFNIKVHKNIWIDYFTVFVPCDIWCWYASSWALNGYTAIHNNFEVKIGTTYTNSGRNCKTVKLQIDSGFVSLSTTMLCTFSMCNIINKQI